MADRYYGYRPRTAGRQCDQLDSKEMLKAEMFEQIQGPGAIPSTISPSSVGFIDNGIYFDSRYRNRTSDYSIGEIKWQISALNNNLPLVNTIEIQIPSFYFPKIYGPVDRPEFFYLRRIFMEIQGLPAIGAIKGPVNEKFHFEFIINNLTNQAVELVPVQKSFFLQTPLNSFDNFDVYFKIPHTVLPTAPMKKVPIPHEIVRIRSAMEAEAGYTPIRFDIIGGDDTTVLGPIGSLGSPGVAVFITGFNSNDAAVNTAVNNLDGVYATIVHSTQQFAIAEINGYPVDRPYEATMYIPKNRIAFAARFTTISPQPTNFVDVTHD